MGSGWTLALIGVAAALGTMFHGVEGWKDYDGSKVIHVGGKVMCQDCTKGWNQWVHGANPIKGSRVAVTCMDARRRVVYYASDNTDEHGEFDLLVTKYIYGKELPPEGCTVRLVSSPDHTCNINIMTNFGGGQTGVKLRRPSHVYPNLVKYTVGPFYFTSSICNEPRQGRGY
ncbi:LOW QUALITY PROTEIN: pistil-specific extensin-like protein [Phoenix dactylifera]|uniref:LOW QUALITY PROTEIN: pistil-specific extensin-like protein n=1 Tax=Phoenix dactylifera TaxID=42345 RepID=A0A8B7CPK4_PHODC|nr:LOW QUALITY PROTEIN: pistil-specific extensin-like protein [Phoenix dactylifera]